jgi:glycosyltransferase involved in cell wall biosynthesis
MMNKIFCIIAARNESQYLPGFLSHIGPYVDGIIGLDDGSTDETISIFQRSKEVISLLRGPPPEIVHGNETINRSRLLKEARRLGASWILCGDADERYEESFLKELQTHIQHGNISGDFVRCVRVVNLWDSHTHYRVDGLCGPRWAPRMFKLPENFTSRAAQELHRPWYPPELDGVPKTNMEANLYHLRMISAEDRWLRWQKFRLADPNNLHQTIGYNHLIDERGLTLEEIPEERGFSFY